MDLGLEVGLDPVDEGREFELKGLQARRLVLVVVCKSAIIHVNDRDFSKWARQVS